MTTKQPTWCVFTKHWGPLSGAPLGELVAGLGFTGAEVPVRPGCWVEPSNAAERLPQLVREMADHGVKVATIAADPTEEMLAACAKSGVPEIRIMADLSADGYRASVDRWRRRLADLADACAQYGVSIGIQPHRAAYVSTVNGVLELIGDLPSQGFHMVWDAAHDALAGQDPVTTLDLAGDRLSMVNLKNALYREVSGEGSTASFEVWYGPAGRGMANWPRILGHLIQTGWDGPICLTGEYTDYKGIEFGDQIAEAVRQDLAAAKAWWEAAQG